MLLVLMLVLMLLVLMLRLRLSMLVLVCSARCQPHLLLPPPLLLLTMGLTTMRVQQVPVVGWTCSLLLLTMRPALPPAGPPSSLPCCGCGRPASQTCATRACARA